jgi:hypothetical protein
MATNDVAVGKIVLQSPNGQRRLAWSWGTTVSFAQNSLGWRRANGSHFLRATEARLARSTSAEIARAPDRHSAPAALIRCHLRTVEQAMLWTLALGHSQTCLRAL